MTASEDIFSAEKTRGYQAAECFSEHSLSVPQGGFGDIGILLLLGDSLPGHRKPHIIPTIPTYLTYLVRKISVQKCEVSHSQGLRT